MLVPYIRRVLRAAGGRGVKPPSSKSPQLVQLIIVGYNLLAQISVAKLHKLWESTKQMGRKKRKYYEKHRRPRRTTSGYRADVCEALIPSRKQEAQSASPHKLSQEGRRVSYGSPVRRIHRARKNPASYTT